MKTKKISVQDSKQYMKNSHDKLAVGKLWFQDKT